MALLSFFFFFFFCIDEWLWSKSTLVSSRGNQYIYNFESKCRICRSKHFHSIMFKKTRLLAALIVRGKKIQDTAGNILWIKKKLEWLRELNYKAIRDFCISETCYCCTSLKLSFISKLFQGLLVVILCMILYPKYRISVESALAVHCGGGQQIEFLFFSYLFLPSSNPSLILVPDLTFQGIFDAITPFLGKVKEYLIFHSI